MHSSLQGGKKKKGICISVWGSFLKSLSGLTSDSIHVRNNLSSIDIYVLHKNV